MAQVHQFLTEVPRFLGFLKIRCQASAAAGLEKPPPSGDRWLVPVTRIVCCHVGARRPLRCEQPSSSSWPPSASCRRGQDWQLQGPCCGSVFFLRRRAAEEKNGLGQIEYRFAEYEYDEIRCEARTKRSPRTRIFVTSISDALELLAEIFRPLTLLVPVLDFPGPRIRNRL